MQNKRIICVGKIQNSRRELIWIDENMNKKKEVQYGDGRKKLPNVQI